VEDDGQLIQPIVHQIHPSNTPVETAFQSDEDSDDSTYQPSHDGDDIEWEADSDEEPHEQNGMSTYPDSTLSHTLSPSTSNNSHSCPPSPDPSNLRRSARSSKGVHTPFYGYYTSIKEQIKQFGDPGVEAIRQELEKMISKEVWEPIVPSSLTPNEKEKVINSKMFLKQKESQMEQPTK
jgi:hypothetical protein